jgi:hypothetical protein
MDADNLLSFHPCCVLHMRALYRLERITLHFALFRFTERVHAVDASLVRLGASHAAPCSQSRLMFVTLRPCLWRREVVS